MTDQVLGALKILLLALIYLFFARVLWSVWSEVRTPVVAPHGGRTGVFGGRRPPKASDGKRVFIVIEPTEYRGSSYTLSDTLTVGRISDNDIAMPNDTFMSSHHARLELRPDGAWLVDLNSTNGSFVNGQKVTGDRSVRKGDRIQVGSTVMEAR